MIGMASGTLMMTLGATQVSAAWLSQDLPSADRWKLGLVAAGFVGLGTALQVLASRELAVRMGDDAA